MKKYEILDIAVEALSSSDVIATSGQITTEDINVPWGSGAFEL